MKKSYVVVADNANGKPYSSRPFDHIAIANTHAKLLRNTLDQRTATPKYTGVEVLTVYNF